MMSKYEVLVGGAELTAQDGAALRSSLARLHAIDDDAFHACLRHCRVRILAKGEYLLRGGEPATQAGMLLKGLLREHFVLDDGTERTKAFVLEGDPTGSLADLLSGRASVAYIVAEEPSRVLSIAFAHLVRLVEAFPAWKAYGVQLMKQLYAKKAERERELLSLDARARYELFLAQYPALRGRVTDRHVASYLGITPVHLSRLRTRKLRLTSSSRRRDD